MNKYRCVSRVSFLNDLGRGFEIGDEVETALPLDKTVLHRGKPAFVFVEEIVHEEPDAGPQRLELDEMKVDELREVAKMLHLEEQTKDLKKDELLEYLQNIGQAAEPGEE